MTELYIKNMVCKCCIYVVREELKRHGLQPIEVDLGRVTIKEALDDNVKEKFGNKLSEYGLGLIDNSKNWLVENVKKIVREKIFQEENLPSKINWPNFLLDNLNQKYSYSYIFNLFRSIEGITIERYIIQEKINRVKQLLTYENLSLGETAKKLGYSSVQHLSAQLKKITGHNASYFKNKIAK